MSNPTGDLMERNLREVFGQRDSDRRTVAISELYTEDCTLFEAEEQIVGRDSLNERVEHILQHAPGFVFGLVGTPQVNHDHGRMQWQFGPDGAACCYRDGCRDLRARENPRPLYVSRQCCEPLLIAVLSERLTR
jgi:hypothetical protein